jgi:hydrogenase expression/formation protein HypE
MAEAAREAGVSVVTGDTKVVGRGSCDKMFINTCGIGTVPDGVVLSADRARPGDVIVLSGTLGDHGMAVMSQRAGLGLEGAGIASDTAALHGLVATMMEASTQIHAMRDPTRGGAGATLQEIAQASGIGVEIDEDALPVRDAVRGACEVLGLDPVFVANEGKLIAFIAPEAAATVLAAMRRHPLGREAVAIGRATGDHRGHVVVGTAIGSSRVLERPYGELLPRIC